MKGLLVFSAVLALALAAPPKIRSPKPQLDGRIIGGQAVNIEEFNHQLSFLWWNSHICGAVLISPTWITTAGHCVEGATVAPISFRGGSNYHNSGGQTIAAVDIFLHPQYNSWDIDFDISVVLLAQAFQLGPSVGIIALPQLNQVWESGRESTVSGWGTTSEGGSLSTYLQAVTVPIVSNEECNAAYGQGSVTPSMLCAGVPQGGLDACQGDSGGPLIVRDPLQLAGLVSWGYGCARPGFPGVYSDVGYLVGFITEITGLS